MIEIVIGTRNRHKFGELKAMLPTAGIRWRSLSEFPQVSAIRESGRSFEANAIRKARGVARATGCFALADDSGLEVKALDGAPGIRSARFSGPRASDTANNRKLLRLLDGVAPRRRGARYRCALALASPTRLMGVVHGHWDGRIASKPAGRGGFGYDPVFLVPRFQKTVGQLPGWVKQRLSHRAAAAQRLQPILRRLAGEAATSGRRTRSRPRR